MKLMRKNAGVVESLLTGDVISPSMHTYGYLALLAAKAGTDFKNHGDYVEQCRMLLCNAEETQLVLGQSLLAQVTRKLIGSLGPAGDKWARAVLPLQQACLKLDSQLNATLTPTHADFLLVCVKAKYYSVAAAVVDQPRFDLDPKESGIEPLDFLQYYFYGGLVYIGLKQFTKALEMFQMALTIPTMALSAVQVEAFKKYVLVSLLVHGEFARLPEKTTSHVVLKNVDRLSPAYMELARAYRRGDIDEVKKIMEVQAETFIKDKNLGLVKQTIVALTRANIQRLTKTYVTLSISDLALQSGLVSPAEAERSVLNMIEDGAIFASINQRDGMISFLEDPEEYDTKEMVEKIDEKIHQAMALATKISDVERELLLNPTYLTKTNPQLLAGGREGGGGGGMSADEMQMKIAMEESLRTN